MCLKILIKALVFVLYYLEDGILDKNTKNRKSYPFFIINKKPGPKNLRHASLEKNVFKIWYMQV